MIFGRSDGAKPGGSNQATSPSDSCFFGFWFLVFLVGEIGLQHGDKVVNRYSCECGGAHGASCRKHDGGFGHRVFVGGFNNVEKIVLAHQRILGNDFEADRFNFASNLVNPFRVLPQGFPAVGAKGGQHRKGRHGLETTGEVLCELGSVAVASCWSVTLTRPRLARSGSARHDLGLER